MIHSRTPGPGDRTVEPALPGLCPPDMLTTVADLRDSTEGVFLATGSQLTEVATLLDAARQGALSLDRLSRTDLLDRLRDEAGLQSSAFDGLAREFDEVRSRIRALSDALGDLAKDLQDVRRSVVTMRIVVLNARVTLAALHADDQRLANFAQSGQGVVAETADLLSRFEEAMLTIGRLIDSISQVVGTIDATLAADVFVAFRQLMQDVAAFEKAVRAVSGSGADLSRVLQGLIDATSRAVSGLQVGDSTRQQLDHVAFILALPEGADPALAALAAALVVDAAQVHGRMLGQLRSSVGQMIHGLNGLVETHLAGFLGLGGTAAGASALFEDSARLGQAIAALHPLQDQAMLLGRSMAAEFEAFRLLVRQGEDVQHSTRQIGINAVLSCMRLGAEGLALKVVAEQLQEVAGGVGARFAAIRAGLERISGLGTEITMATSRLVRDSIEVPERLAGSLGPMIATVADHLHPVNEAVERLRNRLTGLNLDFGPAQQHDRQLQQLAAGLEQAAPALGQDGPSDALLQRIAATFTIERERDIFRTVLPGRASLLQQPAEAAPAADLDDGFFL